MAEIETNGAIGKECEKERIIGIESWCKNEEGSPSFRNPNHRIKLEDKLKTYRVLGGLSHMIGAPDDHEITMIKKSLCQDWL